MKYDVIVIGGGAGGLTCSIGSAKIGKKTLLIEKEKIGGECTWSGCIPSKAFIQLSKLVTTNKTSIFAQARELSHQIYHHETPEILKSYGMDVIIGEAVFKNSHQVQVNDEIFTAKKIVICTGSRSFLPPIEGLKNIPFLTNESFFKQDILPKSIVFIGAGVISIELAIPLARLGTEVFILEREHDIFLQEEATVREAMKNILKKNNISLLTSVQVLNFKKQEGSVLVSFEQNQEKKSITIEKVFVSAGRTPNVESLHLEEVNIKFTSQGISVDPYLRTSVSNVYALGDVVGPLRFSHVAGCQGELFIRNLLFPWFPKKVALNNIPYVIFSEPEFSRIGLTEENAVKVYSGRIKVYEFFAKDSDRAVISLEEDFYLKIICSKGYIVGASVMGQKAGEIVNLLQWLSVSKTPLRKFSSVVQAYPSYGDLIRKISKQAMLDDLFSNPIISMIRFVFSKQRH